MEFTKEELNKELLRRKANKDFWTFCILWDYNFFKTRENVLKQVADLLTKAYFSEKEHIKIKIAMPPRIGKTYIMNLFKTWCLGINPDREIISATYSLDLSSQLHKTVREMIQSATFKSIFKHNLKDLSIENADLLQFKGFYRPNLMATSVGGATTGMGASITILDDAYKDMNEALSESVNSKTISWYKTALSTRLDSKSGESKLELLVGTSWQKEDLSSILEESGYFDHVIKVAALLNGKSFNEKIFTTKYLLDRLKSLESDFQAMYQQEPVLANNALLDPSNIKYVEYGTYNVLHRVVMIDGKTTGKDFYVVLVGAVTDFGIVFEDVIRTQNVLDDYLEDRIVHLINYYEPFRTFVETNQDYSMYRNLKKRVKPNRVVSFRSEDNKEEKLQSHARYLRKIYFISDGDAEYKSYLKQIFRFDPTVKSKHDDDMDCSIMLIIKFLSLKQLGGQKWLT